jgi:hypothetical protein
MMGTLEKDNEGSGLVTGSSLKTDQLLSNIFERPFRL